MKILLFLPVAVFFTQIAIAAGPGDAITIGESTKRPAEAGAVSKDVVTPAASVPVRLTDAEMDRVVGGLMFMYYGIPSGKSFFKTLPSAGGPHGPITRDTKGVSQTIP